MTAFKTTSDAHTAAKSFAESSGRTVVDFIPLPGQSGRVAPGGGAPVTSLLNAAKLTVPQAAMRLGIGETKMRMVIQRGGIPVLRIGGKVVVIEQDIENYLRGCYGRLMPTAHPTSKPKVTPLPKEISYSPWLKKTGTEP